jgi:hypothetical protein
MTTALSVWLVAILLAAAALKALQRDRAAPALATYGIHRLTVQRAIVVLLIVAELGLAGAVTAGAPWAAAAVAGLFLAFAVVTSAALIAGRAGEPCACFGGASRLGWWSPIRCAGIAVLASAVALRWLPSAPTRYDEWLTAGLSVSLLAIVALGLAVLALAREVGVLRLAMSDRGALEVLDEGPELGTAQPWAGSAHANSRSLMKLAIFTSEGCPLCRQLAPAIAHVAGDPLLAVRVFDEAADSQVFSEARVPGSPYAVALELNGVALAKGTFNTLAQLESILATARDRAREGGLAVVA